MNVVKGVHYPKGFRALTKGVLNAKNDRLATRVVSLLTGKHALKMYSELQQLKLFDELFPALKDLNKGDLNAHFENIFSNIHEQENPTVYLFSLCLWPAVNNLPHENFHAECQKILQDQNTVTFIDYHVQNIIISQWMNDASLWKCCR